MSSEIYYIDPAHSNIGFKVTHMMLAQVNGRFEDYEASIEIKEGYFESAVMKFTARADSISTNHKERDAHLKSADFFDTDLHREVSFISSAIEQTGKLQYSIEGFLTMHGLTNHVELAAVRSDYVEDSEGHKRFALSIKGKINRTKWDMKWNKPLQSGGILVSREILIVIDSEFST